MNKNFQKEFDRLNSKQREAVETIEGPVMVIAGPGTGKTQIIAMRIANILQRAHVKPGNVLALTFTNSGVRAMKERLLQIIGPASYQVHVHTFHSFCNEVINTFPEKFLFSKELNQLSDLEQIVLIQKIIDETTLEKIKPPKSPYHYQRDILSAISTLKQESINPGMFKEIVEKELANWENIEDLYHDKGSSKGKIKAKYLDLKEEILKNQELALVYQHYYEELQKKGEYDYADMILFVTDKFKNDPDILSFYQEKFQYILVDEYQDTNTSQNEVVYLLSNFYENPNIFVVGDDEQSIFRFQGASLENILFFKRQYPQTQVIFLENNYRSGQKILNLSRKLIGHNQKQIYQFLKIAKRLVGKEGGKIYSGNFSNGQVESFFIADKINELIKNGHKPGEIAVIYREHRDALNITQYLKKLGIPFLEENEGNVLDDPQIRKILKFLKILNFNTQNNELLFQVMHYEFFNLEVLDIYKLVELSNKNKKSLFESLVSFNEEDFLSPKKIKDFQKIVLDCTHFLRNHTFAESFEHIINQTGFLGYLINLPESAHHLNRLKTLFDRIKNLNTKNKDLDLEKFLIFIDDLEKNNLKIQEEALTANFDGVHLMTAHKSKGLEFETVFIPKLIDKHWGSKAKKQLIKLPCNILKTATKDENDEEERRLFYVALTRAKTNIYLTFASSYGKLDEESLAIPSKFLGEIPATLLNKINSTKYEKQFKKRLQLEFSPIKWQPSENIKDYLSNLISNFSLSATSFNTYLLCPQKFFYNHILRVPRAKEFNPSYGTAIHRALELFFKKQINDLTLPELNNLIEFYHEALKVEILTIKDGARALELGSKNLTKYYSFSQNSWAKNPPLMLEYNFGPHNVHFGEIPIAGKIDKIELLDKASRQVKIVDYKTSQAKSLNHLLGQTKEKDFSFLYQAYFYKLLSEEDPLFEWKIKEVEFEFLTPDKKDKFTSISIPLDKAEYDKFKILVKETYKKVVDLDFSCNKDSCKNAKGDYCEFYDLCSLKIDNPSTK